MGFVSDFLNRKKIDTIAQRLGKQFSQRLPYHRVSDEKRFSGEFEIVLGHIQGVQRTEKLGTFGKARLINGFQWALIENGYDKSFAHKISHSIATRLSKRNAKQKSES